MKMNKKQNIIASIILVSLLIVITTTITVFVHNPKKTYALGATINSVRVINGADIVSIRASSTNGIAGYYIGTANNVNSATYYPNNGKLAFNVSLLNGTYYFWVKDNSGMISRYNGTVTVSNSCSSNFLSNAKGDGSLKHCYYTADGNYFEETKSDQLITCANGYRRDESKTKVIEDTCSSLTAASISSMGLSKKVCHMVWTYSCVPTGGSSSGGSNVLSVVSATTSNDWSNTSKEIVVTSSKGSANIAGYYISTNSSKPTVSSSWVSSSSTTWTTTQGAGTYYIWVKDRAGNISSSYKSVTVSKIETTKPHIDSVIPSSFNKNITVHASDEGGSGVGGYYISNENKAPNLSSAWNNSNSDTFTINKDPGTYYVWVKDAAGNISDSKTVKLSKAAATENNSLASLSIKNMTLTPEFDANVTEYTATATVSKIVIDATLQDSNASFVKNFGPRTVNLKSGVNNVAVKVKSTNDNIKTYTIKVTYNGKSSDNTSARLKSLKLNSGNLTFDPNITEYRMYVPNSLEKLEVEAQAADPNAEVKIENPEKLEVGDNQVVITVNATDGTSTVYTLKIIKKETNQVSTNNYLRSLKITGYEIDFARDILEYEIKLGNRTYLNINAIPEDSNAEVTMDNTKYLTKDSIIHILVRAEDGSARTYTINLNKKGISIGLIILIVIGGIVLLLVIAYFVLRLMGYTVYVNLGAVKDYFLKLFKKNKE